MLRPPVLLLLAVFTLAGLCAPAPSAKAEARDEPITPIPYPPPEDPLKLALGQSLFNDARLSRHGDVSCASCHDLASDGAMRRDAVTGANGEPMAFDTQTVFNAALNFRLNWEGNARTLAAQAQFAIENPNIMGSSMDAVLARLQTDEPMRRAFQAAYGHALDAASLLDAVAVFERTLLTPGSRFDRWLRGDDAALTPEELDGYKTFKAVGCVACHQGVNVGGNLFELHGIFRAFGGPAPKLLRVPSLRNIADTAPYFHDGSAPTLHAAVRTMAAAQLGRDLSPDQVSGIVAFLQTLTGSYDGGPVTRPK